ncbi:MAG TPA: DUF1080 domain-containing protein [Candidatus Desulfaltia sp.]|nr:DUF1080 domain-containing protein [Candidatus Desulfaltia sp.]
MSDVGRTKKDKRPLWVLAMLVYVPLVVSLSCRSKEESASTSIPAHAGEQLLNALSEEERAEGWRWLFDGRTLTGWRGIGQEGVPAGHWIVEEGAIKKVPGGEVPRQADGQPIQGGNLMTVQTYGDFELRLEWKIGRGGNSGIKYNVSEEMSRGVPPPQAAIGFEYQILDDNENPDALVGPNRTAASLYDLIAPQNKTLRPVGEYNEARITFRQGHGEHWLNGSKVLKFDLGTPQMEEFVAASKYRDIPGFAEKRRGHIVLQDHGSAVWFRNIRIREYQPE